MKGRFAFDTKRLIWFRFEGGHWCKDLEGEALAHAGRVLQKAYEDEASRQYALGMDPAEPEDAKKRALRLHEKIMRRLDRVNALHRRESTLKLARTGVNTLAITGDEWNADPWLVQARETIIDLRTGEGLAGPVRSEMIMDTRQAGGNGPNPELLDLQGKRIVWASETREGQRLNAEKVKLFTGGDTLSGRLNYSNDMISFKPSHTLFMLTNNKPRISAGDTAVWDRLRLIPFLMRFVDRPEATNERPKDTELPEKLLKEASGILSWLVQGSLTWLREGLNPPPLVTEFGQEYKLDEDPIQQFINERCMVVAGYKAQAKPLHDAFSDWFTDTYGAKASVPSLKRFSDRLRRSFKREEGRNVRFYGLALLNDEY